VSPNECVCGEKNWAKFTDPEYGTVCYSLRANGLKGLLPPYFCKKTRNSGAIFALVILIASIYTCHRVQMKFTEKKLLGSQIRGEERVLPQRKSRVSKRPTVSRIYEDRQQDLGTYRRIDIIEEEM